MKITNKTNGYELSENIENLKKRLIEVASEFFGDSLVEIEFFNYGDTVVFTDVKLNESGVKAYADLHISKDRISLCGYECSNDQLALFERLTYNDEVYNGTFKIKSAIY